MTWRAVTLHTNDDNYITLPNASVSKAEITNYNAPTMATARHVRVGLEYDLPPLDAKRVLSAAALETKGVSSNPPPYIYLLEFADSAVVYDIKFWIISPPDHNKLEDQVRTNIWYRLKENGYDVPFPMQVQLAEKTRMTRADIERRAGALRRVSVLSPLTDEQTITLAQKARDIFLATGQTLFREGDKGETLYVISHGHVEIVMGTEGQTKLLRTLGPGDFFGEMAALTGQPRVATARASGHLKLIEISKENLQEIIKADPTVLEKIGGVIAQRDAEREAAAKAESAPQPATVAEVKRSLMGRMMGWFGLRA
jgi:CRP-like cAMP-binding protein